MKYTECTTEELLHFIRQRLGPLRNKITRQSALKILKRLDRQPRFERFLDLPAEMRNEVYEYLEGETQVLLTCKQVKEEAEGLVR